MKFLGIVLATAVFFTTPIAAFAQSWASVSDDLYGVYVNVPAAFDKTDEVLESGLITRVYGNADSFDNSPKFSVTIAYPGENLDWGSDADTRLSNILQDAEEDKYNPVSKVRRFNFRGFPALSFVTSSNYHSSVHSYFYIMRDRQEIKLWTSDESVARAFFDSLKFR